MNFAGLDATNTTLQAEWNALDAVHRGTLEAESRIRYNNTSFLGM